jgi:hypothetical protein
MSSLKEAIADSAVKNSEREDEKSGSYFLAPPF